MIHFGIPFLSIPLAAIMMYVAFIHFKKKLILKESLFFWQLLWLAFLIVSLFPQLLDPFVKRFNFLRVLDLLIVISFVLLLVLSYNNFLNQQRLERKMEKLLDRFTVIKDNEFKKKKKK